LQAAVRFDAYFIHVPFPGIVGEAVILFARFAVPVFFMTSGFFSYQNDHKTILRKIRKLFYILVFSSCLYNVCNIFQAYILEGVGAVTDYLLSFTDIKNWLLLVVFNVPFSATRLWFLLALIYAYFMQILFDKIKMKSKGILALSVSGIILHFIIGSIMPHFGIGIEEYMCRNFMLLGYPFFGFGFLIRQNQTMFRKYSNTILFVLFTLGILLSQIPLLYESVSVISVGTLLIVFSLFGFALENSEIQYPKWVLKLCNCGLGIYILHKPVALVLQKVFSILSRADNIVTMILFPISVCIVSAIGTMFLLQLSNKQPKKNKGR